MHLRPLTNDEQAWIRDQLRRLRAFVDEHSPEDASAPLALSVLDRALCAWRLGGSAEAADVEAAVDVMSVALGEVLVQHLEMHWSMVQGDRGDELAVHGLPGQGDVLIYVRQLVATRLGKGESDFLQQSYRQIARHMEAMRKAR